MKKILLAIFLSCVLLSYTFGENLIENNTNIRTENSLFNLVQGYVELNTKMKEYKQVSDTNSSTYKQIIDELNQEKQKILSRICLLYTSPSPRDVEESRMPSSA